MVHSWKLYLTSEVREAGIALSLLYMTVLGFDNITYAYCLDQCVSESLLGGMVALSAMFGILGLCDVILGDNYIYAYFPR